jgi:hypothetical protein
MHINLPLPRYIAVYDANRVDRHQEDDASRLDQE